MQSVTVSSQTDPAIRSDGADIDILINVHNVFSFRMDLKDSIRNISDGNSREARRYLDQDFLLVHSPYDFTNVRSLLMEHVDFFFQ